MPPVKIKFYYLRSLDLGVVVGTDSGVSISVGPLSLVLEPELAHVA